MIRDEYENNYFIYTWNGIPNETDINCYLQLGKDVQIHRHCINNNNGKLCQIKNIFIPLNVSLVRIVFEPIHFSESLSNPTQKSFPKSIIDGIKNPFSSMKPNGISLVNNSTLKKIKKLKIYDLNSGLSIFHSPISNISLSRKKSPVQPKSVCKIFLLCFLLLFEFCLEIEILSS